MITRVELVCREISFYPEIKKEVIMETLSKDKELPSMIKEIMAFLVQNAPLLSLSFVPSGQLKDELVHSPVSQVVRQSTF